MLTSIHYMYMFRGKFGKRSDLFRLAFFLDKTSLMVDGFEAILEK